VAGEPDEVGTVDTSAPSGLETPEATPKRGRRRNSVRDMTLSMLVLVALVLVLTAVTTGFSFHVGPPNPSSASKVLTPQNPRADLRSVAGEVHFPLRVPRVPRAWQSNSFAKRAIDSGASTAADVYVGWVTGDGNYLRLDQTGASVADVAKADRHEPAGSGGQGGSDGSAGASGSLRKLGTERVGGSTWVVYPGTRSEHTWVTDRGSARIAITGSGTPKQFRTMAKAVLRAPEVSAAR
jgi:hypothetical protein